MRECQSVLFVRRFLRRYQPNALGRMRYLDGRGVLCNVVHYSREQTSQFDDPRVSGGAGSLRLSLPRSVLLDIVGVLSFPRLLAVLAHCTVQRVLLNLLAVVFGSTATLAFIGAADFLLRMAPRGLELSAAIGACSDFEIEWAHHRIRTGETSGGLARYFSLATFDPPPGQLLYW